MLSQISRKNLVAMGTMLGRFTHSGKFKLTVHALPVIAQYAKFKVWVKPSAEMSFLYGNHVLKSGLGRITENTPAYQVCPPPGSSALTSAASHPHSAV
jgi:60S ribosome subunit biogenesis protein NIP7